MIGLLILIYGGGNLFAYERGRYSVLAEKVDSGIKTEFIVHSSSEIDAKEEVSLNGWKVLSVKRLSSNSQNETKLALLEKDDKSLEKVKKIEQDSVKKTAPSQKAKKYSQQVYKKSKVKPTSKSKAKSINKQVSYCNQVNIFIGQPASLDNGSEQMDINGLKTVISERFNIPEQSIKLEIKKVKN